MTTYPHRLPAMLAWVISAVDGGGGRLLDTPCHVGACIGPFARVVGRLTAEARRHMRMAGYTYDRAGRCWRCAVLLPPAKGE